MLKPMLQDEEEEEEEELKSEQEEADTRLLLHAANEQRYRSMYPQKMQTLESCALRFHFASMFRFLRVFFIFSLFYNNTTYKKKNIYVYIQYTTLLTLLTKNIQYTTKTLQKLHYLLFLTCFIHFFPFLFLFSLFSFPLFLIFPRVKSQFPLSFLFSFLLTKGSGDLIKRG